MTTCYLLTEATPSTESSEKASKWTLSWAYFATHTSSLAYLSAVMVAVWHSCKKN